MSPGPSLPRSPLGKRGWPWADNDGLGDAASVVPPLPRITVITPSLNQGEFIEETIRSIVRQGWPDLEYIVIDGGSTDGTPDVVRKYAPWISHWVCEPDDGQADAINKGLRRATGDVVTWFNADDVYAPGAFAAVAAAWRKDPCAIYAGPVVNFHSGGRGTLIRPRNVTLDGVVQYWSRRSMWHDPGLFWSRAAIDALGKIDTALRYSFDYDYLVRALQRFPVEPIDRVVAGFRIHRRSKMVTGAERMVDETASVSRRYWPLLATVDRAGFEDSELGLQVWRGYRALLRGDREGLALLWRLRREGPARIARQLALLVAGTIRARLARLGLRADGRFR